MAPADRAAALRATGARQLDVTAYNEQIARGREEWRKSEEGQELAAAEAKLKGTPERIAAAVEKHYNTAPDLKAESARLDALVRQRAAERASAAPDFSHLAKENKIPAKVSDVPAGGKGAFESGGPSAPLGQAERAAVLESEARAARRDERLARGERAALRHERVTAFMKENPTYTGKIKERREPAKGGRNLAGQRIKPFKGQGINLGKLAASEIKASRRAGYGPLKGPRGGR